MIEDLSKNNMAVMLENEAQALGALLQESTKKAEFICTSSNSILAKISEQIISDIDFLIVYGHKVKINDKEYILDKDSRMIRHPKYPYILIKCELRKK